GDIFVKPVQSGTTTDYRRELDISNAVATVTYTVDGIDHRRKYFANYPSRTLIFHFENDSRNGIDYVIRQTTVHKNVTMHLEGNQLIMSGSLTNNGMELESRML